MGALHCPLRGLAFLSLLAACAATGGGPSSSSELRLDVGDLTFDAVAAGPDSGELVLLLHGFPETSHAFRHQLSALAEAGYRAVAVDQRGYSPDARPQGDEAYALPRLVEDAVGFADALGYDRFHVVGHDWGAAVAWFTAMAHPARVRSVAALSVPHPFAFSAALADPEGDQAQRSGYMARFREEGAAAALLADDARALRAIYADPAIDQAAEAAYLRALGTPTALDAALAWYRAMGAAVLFPALTPIRMPALYVWSTADPTMGREGAERTAEYVEGPYTFEVLEGVSHWIPEEEPERVNALLLEHLAGGTR